MPLNSPRRPCAVMATGSRISSRTESAETAVATALYAIWFSDAEAPESRVADQWERRGWWADSAAGSGLWHVRRQALSGAARQEALAVLRDALLTRSAAFSNIEVVDVTPPGNVSSVIVTVSGSHNGRQFALEVAL